MYILMTPHKSVLIKVVCLPLEGCLPCFVFVTPHMAPSATLVALIGVDHGPIKVQSRDKDAISIQSTSFLDIPQLEHASIIYYPSVVYYESYCSERQD